MSKTSELKAKGYKTLKEIGKELGRELRPKDIPKEILRDGVKLNGILFLIKVQLYHLVILKV